MRQAVAQKVLRLSRRIESPIAAPRFGNPARVVCYWDKSELMFELLDANGAILEAHRAAHTNASTDISVQLNESLAAWDNRYGRLPVIVAGLPAAPDGICPIKPSTCPISIEDIPRTAVRLAEISRAIHVVPGLTCLSPVGGADYLFGEETALLGAIRIFPELARRSKVVCIPGDITRWVILRHGHILFFTSSIPCGIFRMLKSDPLFKGEVTNPIINPEVFSRGAAKAEETASTDLIHLLLNVRNRKWKAQLAASDMASYLLGMLIGRDVSQAIEILRLRRLRSIMVLLADHSLGPLYESALAEKGLCPVRIDRARAISAGLTQI